MPKTINFARLISFYLPNWCLIKSETKQFKILMKSISYNSYFYFNIQHIVNVRSSSCSSSASFIFCFVNISFFDSYDIDIVIFHVRYFMRMVFSRSPPVFFSFPFSFSFSIWIFSIFVVIGNILLFQLKQRKQQRKMGTIDQTTPFLMLKDANTVH